MNVDTVLECVDSFSPMFNKGQLYTVYKKDGALGVHSEKGFNSKASMSDFVIHEPEKKLKTTQGTLEKLLELPTVQKGSRLLCIETYTSAFTKGKVYQVEEFGNYGCGVMSDKKVFHTHTMAYFEYTEPAPEPEVESNPQVTHDGNPKHALGQTKPSFRFVPMSAVLTMGQAMENGGVKYGSHNWRNQPVDASVYYDAALRHIAQWYEGNDKADDSGVHHLGHAMACLAIIIDAEFQGGLHDDRPLHHIPLDDFIIQHTRAN